MNGLPAFLPDLIYLGLFLGPFVQEDAAVLAAASLSVNEMRPFGLIYGTVLAGLIMSDIWKYWIGWAALRNPKARAYADKQKAADLGDKVKRHLGATIFAARFVPFSRIPAYVACGFFGVKYWRFCLFVAASAWLYVSIIFLIFHALGEVMGEQLRWFVPVVGFSVLISYLVYRHIQSRRTDTPPDN